MEKEVCLSSTHFSSTVIMPHRGSGGGGRSARARARARARGLGTASSDSSGKTSAPAVSAPPPGPRQAESAEGGIGSAIVDGMAFGGGNAVAHRAVDAVMGPRFIRHGTVAAPAPGAASASMATNNNLAGSDACGFHLQAFQDCLNSSGSDNSKCQFYMDKLSECRKNSGAAVNA